MDGQPSTQSPLTPAIQAPVPQPEPHYTYSLSAFHEPGSQASILHALEAQLMGDVIQEIPGDPQPRPESQPILATSQQPSSSQSSRGFSVPWQVEHLSITSQSAQSSTSSLKRRRTHAHSPSHSPSSPLSPSVFAQLVPLIENEGGLDWNQKADVFFISLIAQMNVHRC